MADIDLQVLKTELLNDPNGYGYAVPLANGNDTLLAEKLNKTRNAIRVERKFADVDEFKEAVNPTEYAALSAAKRDQLAFMTQGTQVRISGAGIRATFADIFSASPISASAIVALRTRDGSRAEELFGVDVVVTDRDIAAARKV